MKVDFKTADIAYITLKSDNQLDFDDSGFLKNKSGLISNWTMVYDEGFDITIGNMNIFLFSKYEPSGKDENGTKLFKSICRETLVGWFINIET